MQSGPRSASQKAPSWAAGRQVPSGPQCPDPGHCGISLSAGSQGLPVGAAALAAITSLGGGWLWLPSRGGYRRDPAPRRSLEHRWEGSVRTVDIPAIDGLNLEAWLFLPHASPAPLVVMAPGLTGGKDGHLEPFAWQFARRGIGVLLIDFRGFGGSQGPRGWVDPSRQRQDYEDARACPGGDR
jgi:hypothetical protein